MPDVVDVAVAASRTILDAQVVDVPATGHEVLELAPRPARPALPQVWQGLDATRPLTTADIPAIQAAFEAWIMKNVAPRKRAPAPQTVRAYLGDSQPFLEWLVEQDLPPLPDWYDGPDALWQLWARLEAEGADSVPLLLITPQLVQAYLEYLVAPGHGGAGGSRTPRAADGSYSPATLSKKRSALNTFFTFTRKARLTVGNPLADMDEVIRAPQDTRSAVEKIKALTWSQAERLLAAVMGAYLTAQNPDKKAGALRDRCMLQLMLLQGLRNIEVYRLNLTDYAPQARGEQGALHILGKGDKERTVLLRPEMQADLDHWLAARALYAFNTPALFVNLHGTEAGQRLSQRSVRERVDVYLEQCGLKRDGVSCHALRHTYATLYVEAKGKDVNREVLAASMGHGDSKITSVYIDWVDMAAENPSAPLMDLRAAAEQRAACTANQPPAGKRPRARKGK